MGRLDSAMRRRRSASPPSVWGVALEAVARGAHDRLGHAQADIRPHDVDDEVEHRRVVDQVDERFMVVYEVAAVHERFGVGVDGALDPPVMAQGLAHGLPSGLFAQRVDLARVKRHFVRRQGGLEDEIAVARPPAALGFGQFPHRLHRNASPGCPRRRPYSAAGPIANAAAPFRRFSFWPIAMRQTCRGRLRARARRTAPPPVRARCASPCPARPAGSRACAARAARGGAGSPARSRAASSRR